jgi:hypothetical protein
MSGFLQAVKEPVARKAIRYLKSDAPEWLARVTVVARAEAWEGSSARWYAGLRPMKVEMDRAALAQLARG